MGKINDFGFPFTSVTGDRQYSASEWRDYFGKLIKNGVIQNDGNVVTVIQQAVANKTVSVGTGSIFINGVMFINDSAKTLTITDNASGNPRKDRIVARLNYTDRKIEFGVLVGTPAGSPVAPTLTRNTTVYELGIADITLANGFSTIVTANILDTRSDVALCGASSMTIGVIPPSGSAAETVTLGATNTTKYGVANVDLALADLFKATYYGKYSQMSGGVAKTGSAQAGIITFTTEDSDYFNAINIGASTSRITIPTGVSLVKFYLKARISALASNTPITLSLYKNGVSVYTIKYLVQAHSEETNYTTPISCVATDYFEVYASTTTASLSSSISAGSIFGMEVLV